MGLFRARSDDEPHCTKAQEKDYNALIRNGLSSKKTKETFIPEPKNAITRRIPRPKYSSTGAGLLKYRSLITQVLEPSTQCTSLCRVSSC